MTSGGGPEAELGVMRALRGDTGSDDDPGGKGWKGLLINLAILAVIVGILALVLIF